ncbi:hypothetical protein ES705_15852 [subsurface metagenome]
MKLFRRKLTIGEFLDALLEIRIDIKKEFQEYIKKKSDFSGDEQLLNMESIIFSLWVISLTIPSKEYKDMLHQKLCDDIGLEGNEIQIFYQQVNKRYANYNYAYNKWVANPQCGYLLGSVITETVVNQNADFSIQGTLPPTDLLTDSEMFLFFGESFKTTLEFIKDLKKDYEIPDLR